MSGHPSTRRSTGNRRMAKLAGGTVLALAVPFATAGAAHAATVGAGQEAASSASSIRTQADAVQQRAQAAKVDAAQAKSQGRAADAAQDKAAQAKQAAQAEKRAAEQKAAQQRAAKKAAEARKSAAADRSETRSQVSAGSANAAKWERIAQCESTGDWSANTGNGYYGGLQFDVSSWKAAGGDKYAPRADMASKNEQMAVADKLASMQGMGSWGCA